MQQSIHPAYGPVVVEDTTTGDRFLTRSTYQTDASTTWSDGQSYPLMRVEVSSFSHPFWTGQARVLDSEGRVEKFNRRYGRSAR